VPSSASQWCVRYSLYHGPSNLDLNSHAMQNVPAKNVAIELVAALDPVRLTHLCHMAQQTLYKSIGWEL
jgi:hypothetical protein